MRILATLVFAPASFAAPAVSMSAGGESSGKVQASLDFRIVIPETLHVDSQGGRRKRSQPFDTRTPGCTRAGPS